jgi:ABC-type nickel/cobalt efflux system permease component RcnA
MTGRARLRRSLASALLALAAAAIVPAVTLAHPLGNFTINHFAAIRVAPDRVSLDVVIDRAEIPAFQEQQRLDTDRDGTLSAAELAGQAAVGCAALLPDLRLAVAGSALAPAVTAAGLSLPPGAGGLSTMRLVCEYDAVPAVPIAAGTRVSFEDGSFAERIGWREIVVLGDGLLIDGRQSTDRDGAGVSARLTSYPKDLLTQPLDMRSAAVTVSPGGTSLWSWQAPDADPIAAASVGAGNVEASGTVAGVVPGGVVEDLASLVDVRDLTPLAILVSLAIAFGLGVIHAVSPGHGKTIMAAYLVGSGGSTRQAVGLGLAVTVSHTLGVLALAGITLAASSVLPPERLYPILGVGSGALVIAIGGSLLWRRLRDVAAARAAAGAHMHAHGTGHDHEHGSGHSHGDEHRHAGEAPGHSLGGPGHSHGGHGHSHEATGAVSWRGMLALGLSGGLVPSASALILLLGSIAAGRVAYGLVLVLGFGLGMAVVLTGIGLLLVRARRLVERRPSAAGLRRLALPIQLATASLVVVLGLVLTSQALTQVL